MNKRCKIIVEETIEGETNTDTYEGHTYSLSISDRENDQTRNIISIAKEEDVFILIANKIESSMEILINRGVDKLDALNIVSRGVLAGMQQHRLRIMEECNCHDGRQKNLYN